MTEVEFLEAFRKVAGGFRLTCISKRIRGDAYFCPLEAVAGRYGVETAWRWLGLETGLAYRIVVAADTDNPDNPLRTAMIRIIEEEKDAKRSS